MRQHSAFEFWMRTGRHPAPEPEAKFNPWHDPDDGRFTYANQGRYLGRGSAAADPAKPTQQLAVPPKLNPGTPRARPAPRAQEDRMAQAHREREAFKRHMIPKEGYRNDVYPDSRGYPTVGIGHKVTPADKLKIGDRISDARIDALWQRDSQNALSEAKIQMREAGISEPAFLSDLADVNFQLGGRWYREHRRTWTAIKTRRYGAAAKEVENSTWLQQTPRRARSFAQALRRLELAEALRRRAAEEDSRNRGAVRR